MVAFTLVQTSQQSAGTVVVGGSTENNAHYCGTWGGAMEASRHCSPNASEFREELCPEEAGERQLRQE